MSTIKPASASYKMSSSPKKGISK